MLKLFDRSWLAIVMLLTVAALPMRTHAQAPTVVFSEIAWAGSSISSSDEWIELTNVGNETIDLSGWILTGAGSSETDLVLPEDSVIQPHSTFLISNYELAHTNTALAVTPNYVTATLSLPNGGFNLHLYDHGGTLVDVAGGAGTPFAGRSGGTANTDDGQYRSMVRVDGLNNGSLPESWMDAQTSQGFLDGIEDYGTPGAIAFESLIVEEETVEDPDTEDLPEEESVEEEFAEESTDEATIRISEFVVDPNEGENEWIELLNAGEATLDVTDWTVEDATGKQTVLEGTVGAGTYLLIDAPLGKLNNDTDMIILKDATGTIVDSVEYGTDELPTPKDGASLARSDTGAFELSYTTTPGSMNVIIHEKPEVLEEVEETMIEEAESVVVNPAVETESVAVETTVEESVVEESVANEPVDSTPVESVEFFGGILISEFITDPVGDGVEWVELSNKNNIEVLLVGWSIEDASGKITDLSSISIEAEGYVVVESPKGKLNNDGDSVILKNAKGTIVDSVTYGGGQYPVPTNGEALARNGATFEITQQPTPGSPNLIFVAIEEVIEVEETTASPTTRDPSSTNEPRQDDTGTQESAELVKTLRFVALYPNTTGSDETEEYIEILNIGTESVDLSDWAIEDGSTDRFTFNDSMTVSPGTSVKLYRPETKITLNNTGDTLELIAPDGEVINKVSYGNAAKGATYQVFDGIWKWVGLSATTVTNASPSTNSTQATYTSSTTSTSSNQTVQSMTVAQAKTVSDGIEVVLKGMVTVIPGTFGNQIFYLQDETSGVQIYLYSGAFPELNVGDMVQVQGKLSTSRGERRVKLEGATGVVPASGTVVIGPTTKLLNDVGPSDIGSLLTVEGQIQSKSATKLILEHNGATLTVYLKSQPTIDPNQFDRGDTIEVTGVLSTYDGELRLRPRSESDLVAQEKTVTTSTAIITNTNSNDSSAGLILLYVTMASLALLALWRYVPRRRLTPAAV